MPSGDPLAVYIHWPFCLKKCPYCDFNSHEAVTIDQGRWREALLRDLGSFADETKGRAVGSVFFGGGTPSLMDPETVAALIAGLRAHWPLAEDLEITLEANPGAADRERLDGFFEAGVNRLSMGVQSFDDRALEFLGRVHDADEAIKTIRYVSGIFPRASFDLIYGFPGQSLGEWEGELSQALEFGLGHLSLYQLSVEPGTDFFRDRVEGADEESAAALYDLTQETLAKAGLPAYEISNHARRGEEARHNLGIWRGGDYLAVGPGAHGRLAGEAFHQIADPARWLGAVETGGSGTAKRRKLTPMERRDEILLMGLRLREGVGRDRFFELTGEVLEQSLDARALERLTGGGFLVLDDRGLRATQAGRIRLNAVLADLLG